jgi:galactokinase
LIGEHTDYSGGLVLPVAIQYGVTIDAAPAENEIALRSERFGAAAPFAADGSGPSAEGWARYAQAVAAELDLLGRPAVGLTGTVRSDLPAGAGLSSSAALEVAAALVLCAVADFEVDPLELALACQRAELRAVGVPCGILDQAACVLGRQGSALLLDCGTLEHRLVGLPPGLALLLVHSGIERSLETSAYGERRHELEQALAAVGTDRSADLTAGDLDGLEGVSLRRLRHVVTENDRVRRFADALAAGDVQAAGRLLTETHASLRDDYEVSLPDLDVLAEIAVDAGAYGARLHGGGFGGAVLALVDEPRAEAIGAAVVEAYRSRIGREPRALTVVPSAGAHVRAATHAPS